MLKKMMLLTVSVCALVAVAAPAMAQAQQLYMKGPKGQHNPLPVGAKPLATTINNPGLSISLNNWGTFSCKPSVFGVVLENNAAISRMEGGSAYLKECALKSMTIKEFTINEKEAGLMTNVSYVLAYPSYEPGCRYEGNIPFTYEHDTNTLTIVPGTILYSGECYSYYSEIGGSFELFQYQLGSESLGPPVYIE